MTSPPESERSEAGPSDPVSRRAALLWAGRTALVSSAAVALGSTLWRPPGYRNEAKTGISGARDFRVDDSGPAVTVVAKSSSVPRELVARAVEGLGGMRRFVSPGDVVAIKPNIGWDRTPAQAANTNPEVVAEVVRLAFDAGAKRVVVTDASCNEARRSFQRSGIWRAAHELGAEVVLPASHRFRKHRLRGELLDEWPIYTPLLEADKLINVPVAKHHNLSHYTGAMKNWYGVLGGRRNRLHQNIHVSIADLATFVRPTLTVLDATRVLYRNGPQGGNLSDVRVENQVVASTDQVMVDSYGALLLGVPVARIGYLAMGKERGLGSLLLDDVRFV